MISGMVLQVCHIVANPHEGVAERANAAPVGNSLGSLLIADWILAGLGTIVLLGFFLQLKSDGWRDPLARAPIRESTLREDSIAMAILAYLVAALVLSRAARWLPEGSESPLAETIIGLGAQIIGVGACLAIATRRVAGGASIFLMGHHQTVTSSIRMGVRGLLVVLAVCPVLLVGSVAIMKWWMPNWEFPDHPTIDALQNSESPVSFRILLWLGAALVAPLAEEVFFRGLLQTALLNLRMRRWPAIAVASLAFAVIHQAQPHAIPALFAMAVILGYVYERSGSLIPPIVIHALFNLKTLFWDAQVG